MKLIKFIFKSILCIAILGGILLVYAFKIEPSLMKVKKYDIEANGTSVNESVRIVQVSDVQISETYTVTMLNKLVDKINKQSPDILVFTGDLFENYAQYAPETEVIEALNRLIDCKKIAIWGNRDYGGGAVRTYESIIDAADFILLTNSGTNIETESGAKIFVGGLDDALLGAPDIDSTLSYLEEDAAYKILLTHEPDVADDYAYTPVDLILSGHSHGGQVRLPFVEPLTTTLSEKYVEGFYSINAETGLQLYVNTGIGTSRLPVRFLVPPEITVLDIML